MSEPIPGENPTKAANPKVCVAVSTYKKNDALAVWLESYLSVADRALLGSVVICDDNNGEAHDVFLEFRKKEPLLDYVTGPRVGIARNKNRGLLYFMTKTKDTHVMLSDDDIQWVGPGIEQRFLDAGYGHITGYLGDYNDPLHNQPFFTQFPPYAANDDLWFCRGSQGILLWAWREVVDQVGYFDSDWKGMYGFEHAVWSMRINRAYGNFIEYFPILQGCGKYFQTQMIGNNYGPDYVIDKKTKKPMEVDGELILINRDHYLKRREEVHNGIGIYKGNPGVTI